MKSLAFQVSGITGEFSGMAPVLVKDNTENAFNCTPKWSRIQAHPGAMLIENLDENPWSYARFAVGPGWPG